MGITGCGEVWSAVSTSATAWALTTSSASTFVDASTYCPVTSGAYYDSIAVLYDSTSTIYDAT